MYDESRVSRSDLLAMISDHIPEVYPEYGIKKTEAQAERVLEDLYILARCAISKCRVVAALANIPSNRYPDDLVFGYASGESVGQVWKNVVKRAGIQHLTPHCCRHGFATSMLQAGVDPKTVAVRGGWKDVGTVMKFYAHAMDDPTVTDVLFGTNLTQGETKAKLRN